MLAFVILNKGTTNAEGLAVSMSVFSLYAHYSMLDWSTWLSSSKDDAQEA